MRAGDSDYAHEVEWPFLSSWPNADVQIDWRMRRAIVELDDDDEIEAADTQRLVTEFGAENISVQAFANAGCGPRLRIVVELGRTA